MNKLSSEAMRDKYSEVLDDIRDKNNDAHNVDNYITTVQDIFNMVRVSIDDKLDVEAIDQQSKGEDGASNNSGKYQANPYATKGSAQKVTIMDKEVTVMDKGETAMDREETILDKEEASLDKEVTIMDKEGTILDKEVTTVDREVTSTTRGSSTLTNPSMSMREET